MWQKKSTTTEVETKSSAGLALRPGPGLSESNPYGTMDLPVGQETTPRPTTRPSRWVWFLGIGLLGISLVGALWGINSSLDQGSTGVGTEVPPSIPGIVALGMVDADPGIRRLSPVQPGTVVEVVTEGKMVKKGEILLRLDNQIAILRLQEAEAAQENARIQLELAKILPKKYAIDKENLEKGISIMLNKKSALYHEVEAKRDLFKDKLVSKHELGAYEDNFKAMEDMVEVERNKLRLLLLQNPQFDVDRAQSDFNSKKTQWKKAKLALDKCDLLAPTDGTVLRVFVHPDEVIAPDAKIPAIQFCPTGKRIIRAEVLQEWAGRVAKGQPVVIQDDTRSATKWTGTVTYVSDWITHKRNVMLEPFLVNDVRTLECLIDVNPGDPLRFGQRVRVTIQQDK